MEKITFTLNGKPVTTEVDGKETLVDVIRDKFRLTGTKKACGTGDCGSCTVLINGKAVRSCITLAFTVNGKEVTTIEGIGTAEHPHALQTSFVEHGAIQCGYCMPGMIMAAKALLDENPKPTEEEIREGLSGNLCRCTGYEKVFAAVKAVAGD